MIAASLMDIIVLVNDLNTYRVININKERVIDNKSKLGESNR